MVQIFDVPVPQKGEELADVLKLFDTQTPRRAGYRSAQDLT